MKEIVFLKQNAEKWKKFESLLKGKKGAGPDETAELFIELTDDLAYSKTFYPESRTTMYLNSITARVHRKIYKNRKEEGGRIFRFWKNDLPLLVFEKKKTLLFAFLVFVVSVLIGWISAAGDESFVRLIMGDRYVRMTLENIGKGDPMAVYKSMNEVEMFLGITLNNIMVAALAFVSGVLFSFGTGYILFNNGVMLGAFHYFFYKKGLLSVAMLSIWIHGVLEISAIILAGSAGMVIGNSILFPGTFSRLHSFRLGAANGLRILVGIVPMFIIAGFLEGFVTRHTEMPLALSLVIIGLSLAAVFYYFIVYPFKLSKSKTDKEEKILDGNDGRKN